MRKVRSSWDWGAWGSPRSLLGLQIAILVPMLGLDFTLGLLRGSPAGAAQWPRWLPVECLAADRPGMRLSWEGVTGSGERGLRAALARGPLQATPLQCSDAPPWLGPAGLQKGSGSLMCWVLCLHGWGSGEGTCPLPVPQRPAPRASCRQGRGVRGWTAGVPLPPLGRACGHCPRPRPGPRPQKRCRRCPRSACHQFPPFFP